MDPFPGLEIRILDRRAATNTGIIEQHIEPAHIGMRGL